MKGFGKQYKSKKNADKKTKFSKEQLIKLSHKKIQRINCKI